MHGAGDKGGGNRSGRYAVVGEAKLEGAVEGGEGEGEVAHDQEILWRGWGGAAYGRLGGLRGGGLLLEV